jgi:hypothetical protein
MTWPHKGFLSQLQPLLMEACVSCMSHPSPYLFSCRTYQLLLTKGKARDFRSGATKTEKIMMKLYNVFAASFLLDWTIFSTTRTAIVHGYVLSPSTFIATTTATSRNSRIKDHLLTTTATATSTSKTFNFILALKATENKNEEFFPATSFGAEVVPEGQRPVNEYLDMKRAPLFDWASNEVGTAGLLMRLVIVYAIVFATV